VVDWKKEIKLGKRAGGAEAPVAATTPDGGEVEEKVPFWKKEIGGGRKAKAAAPDAPTEEKVSFWKKEIGGGRKPRAEAPQPEPVAFEPQPVPRWPERPRTLDAALAELA